MGNDRIEGVLFRSEETFFAGNRYVGPEAAEDPEYIRKVCEGLKHLREAYETLKSDWPKPTGPLLYGAKRPYALWPPMVEGYDGPYANWTELAQEYGGKKTYVEYPTPDQYGAIDLTQRKIHIF